MLNTLFPVVMLFSFVCACCTGAMPSLSESMLTSAGEAVALCIKLSGMMCLWSGLMGLAKQSGITQLVARLMTPVLRLIFPACRDNKEIMGAVAMNITANLLGIGNAATPLGIEAMKKLNTINPSPTRATDEMISFVVMNSAALRIVPTTAALLRKEYGAENPTDIIPCTWIASFCALCAGLLAARALCRKKGESNSGNKKHAARALYSFSPAAAVISFAAVAGTVMKINTFILPGCIIIIVLYSFIKKVRVFDIFTSSAADGIKTCLSILPSLIALMLCVSSLRSSGALDLLCRVLSPAARLLGIPVNIIPLCLISPISGSGSLSVFEELLKRYGADSIEGRTASVIAGATETTFYATSIYFPAASIKNIRHTLPAALTADAVSFIMSSLSVRVLFGK